MKKYFGLFNNHDEHIQNLLFTNLGNIIAINQKNVEFFTQLKSIFQVVMNWFKVRLLKLNIKYIIFIVRNKLEKKEGSLGGSQEVIIIH